MDDLALKMLQLGHQGFSCAQIIVLLTLEMRGEANNALVRSMAGLAYGCGSGRGSCGALTGAACALALYAGKGGPDEEESPSLQVMLEELNEWFLEQVGSQHGGITCEAITGQEGPAASRQKCGALVAEAYAKVMELLVSHEIDPANP
jgi:C_GCAxxG_C_C family probable redox protein